MIRRAPHWPWAVLVLVVGWWLVPGVGAAACTPTVAPSCPYPAALTNAGLASPAWSIPFEGASPFAAPANGATRVTPSGWTNLPSSSTLRILPSQFVDLMNLADTGASSPLPSFPAGGFTLSLYLRFEAWSATVPATVFTRTNAGAQAYTITQTSTSGAFAWNANAGACAFNLVLARWTHIAITAASSGTTVVYLDGVVANTCALPTLVVATTTIASLFGAGGVASGCQGEVARLDYFANTFTAGRVATLNSILPGNVGVAEQLAAVARFAHTFPSALAGAPWFPAPSGVASRGVAAPSHYSHSLDFCTSADAVGATTFGASGVFPAIVDPPLSLTFWIFLTSIQGYGAILKHVSADGNDYWNFYLDGSGGFKIQENVAGSYDYWDLTQGTGTLPLFRWTHVAITMTPTPSTFTLSFNGVQINTRTPTSSAIARPGIAKSQALMYNFDSSQAHDSLAGGATQITGLIVHNSVLAQTDILRLALSIPVALLPAPIIFLMASTMARGATQTVTVYLPIDVAALLPNCFSSSFSVDLTIGIASGSGGSVSASVITFTKAALSQTFVVTYPSTYDTSMQLVFTLPCATDYFKLPFSTFTISLLDGPTIQSTALMHTLFSSASIVAAANYQWMQGLSGVPGTGLAYLSDDAHLVSLVSSADIPDPPLMPTTWGTTTTAQGGFTIGAWMQWVQGTNVYSRFTCSRADGYDLFEMIVGQNAIKAKTQFESSMAVGYSSSGVANLTGDWVYATVVSTADGTISTYLNGTFLNSNAPASGWARNVARPICKLWTSYLGGMFASFHYWPRVLQDAEVALVGARKTWNICKAPCVYANAYWGTFFTGTANAFAGHNTSPAIAGQTYVVYQSCTTALTSTCDATSNVGFDYANTANVGVVMPTVALPTSTLSQGAAANAQFSVTLWVRFLDTSPASLFDWRSSAGADQILLSRDAGALYFSTQSASGTPTVLAAPVPWVLGQWSFLVVTHNVSTSTIYVNAVQVGQSTTMVTPRAVTRAKGTMHDAGLLHMAEIHLFAYAISANERAVLFANAPDSIWQAPVMLVGAPFAIAAGASVTFNVTLPLPLASWSLTTPQSLTATFLLCGGGTIFPPNVTLTASRPTQVVTVTFPADGSTSSTLFVSLVSGDLVRYSAPTPTVFALRAAMATWQQASFGTFMAIQPASMGAWSAGVSPNSGVVVMNDYNGNLDTHSQLDMGSLYTMPSQLALGTGTGMTVSIWTQVTALNTCTTGTNCMAYATYWQIGDTPGNALAFQLDDLVAGLLLDGRRAGSSLDWSCYYAFTIPLNTWLNFAFTLSAASVARLFVNGVNVRTCNFRSLQDVPYPEATVNNMGAGVLTSMHYWPTEMSVADMAQLATYLPPGLTYYPSETADLIYSWSVFGTWFTREPNLSGWMAGPSGVAGTGIAAGLDWGHPIDWSSPSSLDLDTTARWPAVFGSQGGGFTVGMWFRSDLTATDYTSFFSCQGASPTTDVFLLYLSLGGGTTPTIHLKTQVGTGTSLDQSSSTIPFFTGQWMHILVTLLSCDVSPNAFLFFNGVSYASWYVPGNVPNVARTCTTSGWDQAYMASMHVWQQSLTREQVQTLAQAPPASISPSPMSTVAVLTATAMPLTIVATGTQKVFFRLPFQLAQFRASPPTVQINVVTDSGLVVTPLITANTLTDAIPGWSVSIKMPTGARFVTVGVSFTSGGDTLHVSPSSTIVWARNAANIYALATFATWMASSVSVGAWTSQPAPSFVQLSGAQTLNWYNTGQTGAGPSFAALPTTIGANTAGMTLATWVSWPAVGSPYPDILLASNSDDYGTIELYRDQTNGIKLRVTDRAKRITQYCSVTVTPVVNTRYHVAVVMSQFALTYMYLNGVLNQTCNYLPFIRTMARANAIADPASTKENIYSLHYWPIALTLSEVALVDSITSRNGSFAFFSYPATVADGVTHLTPIVIACSGIFHFGVTLTISANPPIVGLSPATFLFPSDSTITSVNLTVTGALSAAYPFGSTSVLTMSLSGTGASWYDAGRPISIVVVPSGECATDDGHLTTRTPSLGTAECPTSPATGLSLASVDFSFAVWVKLADTTAAKSSVFTMGSTAAAGNGLFSLVTTYASPTYTFTWNAASGAINLQPTQTFTPGVWQHVVGTWAAPATHSGIGLQVIYVNGAMLLATEPTVDYTFAGGNAIALGSSLGCGSLGFGGALDEFRVWSAALTAVAVATGYSSSQWASAVAKLEIWYPFSSPVAIDGGVIADASGKGRHATFATAQGYTVWELGDSPCGSYSSQCAIGTQHDGHASITVASGNFACAQFKTAGTEVQVAARDFTVSMYVRRTALQTAAGTVFSLGAQVALPFQFLQVGYSSANLLTLSFGSGDSVVSSTVDNSVGTWVQLTLVVRSRANHPFDATRALWRQGIAAILDGDFVDDFVGSGLVAVGGAGQGLASFPTCTSPIGTAFAIDEFYLWGRALADPEVTGMLTGIPSRQSILLYYPFVDPGTQNALVLPDASANVGSSPLSATSVARSLTKVVT